jgi:hypothetical protein
MRRLLLAFASIALIGCGGSDSTGLAASAEGTWNLSTINGGGLPFTLGTDPTTGATVEILDDQYILNHDGTWTESFTTRETQGTTVTTTPDSDSGTWTQQGNQVEINSSAGGFTGTLSNNAITVSSLYGPVVYVRQ